MTGIATKFTHCSPIHDTVRKRHRALKTRNIASKKTVKVNQPDILPRPGDCESERPLSNA